MGSPKDHTADAEQRDTPLSRFERSMVIDYEKWHDGVGYDIEAIHEATPFERAAIENLLIHRNPLDWRDVEALAELGTPQAIDALKTALHGGSTEVRMAVIRYAPEVLRNVDRINYLRQALRTANLYGGLSQALDLVEEFHPPEVISELLQGVLRREGEVAVLFAAMLFFIHGRADSSFDMKSRPFFLRFNTDNTDERRAAFIELCLIIGIDPEEYVSSR